MPHIRSKRQVDPAYEYKPTKTRCPLLLVADYRFYQEMGGSNTKTTINYLVSLRRNLLNGFKCDCSRWEFFCNHGQNKNFESKMSKKKKDFLNFLPILEAHSLNSEFQRSS